MRAIGFAAGGVVCLLLAVVAAFAPLERHGRVATVLQIGGFGAAMLLSSRLMRPQRLQASRAAPPAASPAPARVERFALAPSRLRYAVAGGIAFAIASVGIALDGHLLMGVVCAAVFGLPALAALRVLRSPNVGEVVLAPSGIRFTSPFAEVATTWDNVVGMERFAIYGAPFLAILLEHPPEIRGPLWMRMLARRGPYAGHFNVGLNSLADDPDVLERAVERRLDTAAAARHHA